jgi:hypothetical protein
MRFAVIVLSVGMCIQIVSIPNWVFGAETASASESGIEPTKPFELHFGRGSGWRGLDTVQIKTNGDVILYRQVRNLSQREWQTATLTISKSDHKAICDALITNQVLNLHNQVATNVSDGIQWILLATQSGHTKAVYFDNLFPPPITNFARTIDLFLDK